MKLDRNIPKNLGRGKYALVKMRKVVQLSEDEVYEALALLKLKGVLDYGNESDSDFFVIRLKDKYASPALAAYAGAAWSDDTEYAQEVFDLAKTAARCERRMPD
jgi:hypothetical protein